jgi:chorismate synthase
MLVFSTAGESHGRGVFSFLDGLPAGLRVDRGVIDADLARRQRGHGRGSRMSIEKDRVDVLSGIRGGITLGSPVLLAVWNNDFENWKQYLDPWEIVEGRELHTPRPGHADLGGAARFRHTDLRNVLERASARETAGRVAAGGLLRSFLGSLRIHVHSWVTRIGPIAYDGTFAMQARDASSVFCPDDVSTREMERSIDRAAHEGDSLGGEFASTGSLRASVLTPSGISVSMGCCPCTSCPSLPSSLFRSAPASHARSSQDQGSTTPSCPPGPGPGRPTMQADWREA